MRRTLMAAAIVAVQIGSTTATAESAARMEIVSATAELQYAFDGFVQLQPLLPDVDGTSQLTEGPYDRALHALDEARHTLGSAGLTDAAPAAFRAYTGFERLMYQIPFERMELLQRARALADYGNALGAARRVAMIAPLPEERAVIAHGLFLNTYDTGRSQRRLWVYASTQCRERGFNDAQALDDLPCGFPMTDTILCKGAFACVD